MPPKSGTVAPAQKETPKTEAKEERAPLYVPGETVTEEEWARMSAAERERYEGEKEAAYLKRAREEQERVVALKKKYAKKDVKAEVTPPTCSVPEAPEGEEDEFDEEFNENEFKKSGKVKNCRKICRKYRIKPKELRRGIERARELFVPQMIKSESNQAVVLALIDLLEFGDIK